MSPLIERLRLLHLMLHAAAFRSLFVQMLIYMPA